MDLDAVAIQLATAVISPFNKTLKVARQRFGLENQFVRDNQTAHLNLPQEAVSESR